MRNVKAVMTISRHYSIIQLKGISKTVTNTRQDSQSIGRIQSRYLPITYVKLLEFDFNPSCAEFNLQSK